MGLGTFYLHFKTKNEIFIELIETGAAELRAEVNAAKAGIESVEDKLRITIDTILDAAAEHPEQFRIVFGHGPAFLDLMVRVHEMFIEDLRRDFEPTLGERANAVANLTIGMLVAGGVMAAGAHRFAVSRNQATHGRFCAGRPGACRAEQWTLNLSCR